MVVTDHKPLVKIFGDRALDKITNTRLFRLKQRTLMRRFEIAHLPGMTNQAADATSRYLVPCDYLTTIESADCASPDHEETALLAAVEQDISHNLCLQWSELAHETDSDSALKKLLPVKRMASLVYLICFESSVMMFVRHVRFYSTSSVFTSICCTTIYCD